MIKKMLFAVMILIASSTFAQNEEVLKLSIEKSKEMAKEYNYTLKRSSADIESAEKKIWETISIGLPQISADASYAYSVEINELLKQFAPDMSKHSADANITLQQLIFSGSYIVGLKSSTVYRDLYKLIDIKNDQDVMQAITNSYIAVLVTEENVKILEQTDSNVRKIYNDTKAMYEEGFVEDTDVDQLALILADLDNSTELIKRQQILAQRYLKYQIGIDINREIELTESLESIIDNLNLQTLSKMDFDVKDNISYKLIDNQQNLAELNVMLEKSAYLPTVAGYYNHYENLVDGSFTMTPADVLGVKVQLPIFSSGGRKSKVDQAKIELDKALINKEESINGLQLQYEEAKSNYLLNIDRYNNDKKSLELSERIYNKTMIKYKEGISSSFDLTQAQNQYLEAQSSYFGTIMELLNKRTELETILIKE